MTTKIKTAYTIEETNLERQHLLAEFLNPVSLNALETLSLKRDAKILDLGCGLGDTTLMLHLRFPGVAITGVDADESLIEAANATKANLYPQLQFVAGDALHLHFEDDSFDFVFSRYMLHHIPDALAALKEMKRVCKTGGIVFAQDPDVNFFQTYPESHAYPQMKEMVNALFADALIGRKLIHYFRKTGLKNISHNAQTILADHRSSMKKFYRMTAEAISKPILERKLMDEKQLEEWLDEMKKMENDPDTIALTHPIIAVWGFK